MIFIFSLAGIVYFMLLNKKKQKRDHPIESHTLREIYMKKYSELMKPTAPHIHTNMPDVDNLSKFILDAMNEVFYEDDRQVVELNSHKEYVNDKKNTTGYTIVHITPYEKKSSFFNPEQTEGFVLTREYMENNKTKNIFNKIFPNHVPDSSSESM